MSKTQGSRPSAALVVATIALAAAVTTTAIAGPDALTRAVSAGKVKKIASKQIKKQAVLGPGKVITRTLRPNIVGSGYVPVLKVPGYFQFAVACDASQMNWDVINKSGQTMDFTGFTLIQGQNIGNDDSVENGDPFGLIGGNLGNYEVTIQATGRSKAFSFNALAMPITGEECPWSVQAIVTK